MSKRKERPLPKLAIDWRRHRLALLAIVALAFVAYSNSFGGGLIYDAKIVVHDDPRIRAVTAQHWHQIWSTGYWYDLQDPTLYRPLTTTSYLFNYAVLGNGDAPAGYHAVNLALHTVNALLVYALGLLLFRRRMPAATLAALWAVHPVLTESVTNVVGRADVLSGFGLLAALLCHVYAADENGRRKLLWLTGVVIGSAIAIFSKESGVVLIALMLVYDFGFRRPELRRCVPGYAAMAVPFAVFFAMRASVLSGLPAAYPSFPSNPLVTAGFVASRLTAVDVLGRYMLLLAWPARLSPDYSFNQIPVGISAGAIVALLACLAAAALGIVWYRRKIPAFFFVALFFLPLAPVANIAMPIGTIMAERFLYLPAIGFIGCIVWSAYAFEDRIPKLPWIFGAICLALLVRTYVRNPDWYTTHSLFASAARVSPNSFRAHENLALAWYRDLGNVDRAIPEITRAVEILNPLPPEHDDGGALYPNAAIIYRAKGESVASGSPEDAANWYRKSLDVLLRGVKVDQVQSAAMARTNQEAGRPAAIFGTYLVYVELARTYLRLAEPAKAIEAVEYGSYLNPNIEFFELMSEARKAQHDDAGAAVALLEGLVIDPGQSALAAKLVNVYQGAANPGCAVQQNRIDLQCPQVRANLCDATGKVRELYARRGQTGEAEKIRMTAVRSFGCPAQ